MMRRDCYHCYCYCYCHYCYCYHCYCYDAIMMMRRIEDERRDCLPADRWESAGIQTHWWMIRSPPHLPHSPNISSPFSPSPTFPSLPSLSPPLPCLPSLPLIFPSPFCPNVPCPPFLAPKPLLMDYLRDVITISILHIPMIVAWTKTTAVLITTMPCPPPRDGWSREYRYFWRIEDPLMADERSGPNRGWIRNHLMQCTPACSHCHHLHHHHHHLLLVCRQHDLLEKRIWQSRSDIGAAENAIIGNPTGSHCQLQTQDGSHFLPHLLSLLQFRATRTLEFSQISPELLLFACLFIARIRFVHKPFLWLNPWWQHSVCQARTRPCYRNRAECPHPTTQQHLLHCSLVGMLCCCGSAQLMRHLPLARDHVLSPQPNKSEGVSPGYWGGP